MSKAQSPIAFVFIVIFFAIAWALFLGPFLIAVGQANVIGQQMTGMEAWIHSSYNLFVGVFFFVYIVAYGYLAGA